MGDTQSINAQRTALNQCQPKANQGPFKSAKCQAGFARLGFTTCLAAAALAFVMAAAINLDAPDDHQAEWDQSEALIALQASQARTARREAAALRLCLQERGPGAAAMWTADGSLVCRARKGLATTTLEASL